jgi:hypothetical protein
MNEIWVWSRDRNTVTSKFKVLWVKPATVPLCPSQMPHGQTRNRKRASASRRRQQSAWAVTSPYSIRKDILRRSYVNIRLRFSQRWLRKIQYSVTWRHIVWKKSTDVSEGYFILIFRVWVLFYTVINFYRTVTSHKSAFCNVYVCIA